MITANNLSFEFSGEPLYENVNFDLHPKQRIGIVGRNGTGKSTMLRLLNKEYQPTSGNLNFQSGLKISFFNQDLLSYQTDENLYTVVAAVFGDVLQLHDELDRIAHQMEVNYTDDLLAKMTKVQDALEAADAYTIESRIKKVLSGLGFSEADCDLPYGTFSGGWRMRAQLAKCLLAKPDVLMLDEPTNHLDLPAIEWLESYLKGYEGTLIVVSHDRYLLDRLCTRILEVNHRKITSWTGNFSSFLEQKEEAMMLQSAAYKNQQQKLKQEERFIERFRAKASKAKAVKSRIKLLEKLDRIDAPESESSSMDLRLTVKTQPGRTILELHDVKKSFGDKQVLKGCDALMERGDKIALIGANGMGKSTLLRIMAGLTEHTGTLKLGHNVKPAYFAQHQAEALDPNRTMLDELAYHAGGMIERELRTILGAFLFTGEDVLKKTGVLSGGEKARVALAKLITSDANFLLLDEPTNHLDMLSVEVLMEALERYEGTYIVVSHDRYFLSEIANKIWYIEEGFLKEYPGTYEEFEEWKAERDAKKPKQNSSSAIAKSEKAPESSSTKQSAAKPASNQLAKLQKELAELELKQNAKRAEISMLEAEAIMPDVYTNKSKMATVVDKLHACRVELQKLDEHWEAMFAKMIEEES